MMLGARWAGHDLASGAAQQWPASAVLAFGCLFLAIFLVGALLIGMVRPDDRAKRLAARIERYGSRHMAARSGRSTSRLAYRLVAPVLHVGRTEEGLALRLDLAGIERDPAEWVLVGTGASLVLIIVLTLLFGNVLLALVLGVLGGSGWA